jgi:lipopolysaccharide transport system permease protein
MLKLFKDTYEYRELIFTLVQKEIAVRYKQSLLGPCWALIQPLAFMAIFMAVRIFLSIPSDGVPYPIFVFAGLLPWTFFSNSVTYAAPSIVLNGSVIKKIYFPREVFPLSVSLATFFDFAIAGVIYLIMMFYYGIYPGPSIWLLPVLVLFQFLLALGLALVFSIMGGYRRDFIMGAPLLMMFWMYLSPVFYPVSSVPQKFLHLYFLNPMAGIIQGYRSILLNQDFPSLLPLACSILTSLIILQIGAVVFRRLAMTLADVV